ncbi:hypothetical protein BKA62DRAFT_721527 [Auriculariales sp. MPI-PUGE-AT-0066]|nr:hypothetical protein BKA62DRAFT_721527 [Auriculariales sp. MPI-PUGE-AT-0066]
MPASLEALYRDRLRQDVVGEAIWEANRNGEVGDIGYIHYDGRFHKLFNIFDGNGVIPAPPELMRTQIFSQSYPEPKSYGATFRNKIGAGFGVDVPAQIIVANVQFSVGNRSAAFLHPRSPTTEKWFEETGLLSTYLMEHESEIKERYSRNHDFDTIWIIEATIHAASYRHGVVYSSERNAAGTLEMHPIIASGASVSIHYTTEDLHNPIIRGRECPEADADMHCIVIRPVRLRKRRYLKMQSTKVLVSVTSAFRSTLGGLFRSSASTSNPSTDRSLTRRGGDGRTGARDEAGGTHAADSLEGKMSIAAEMQT